MKDYSAEIQELASVEDYLANILPHIRRGALKRGVAAACKVVRDAAKARCPVSSGTLRDSLSYVVREYDESIVGVVGVRRGATAVVDGKTRDANQYGHLVEFGHVVKNFSGDTERIEANPFLRSAADETQLEQEAAILVSLSRDLRESKEADWWPPLAS